MKNYYRRLKSLLNGRNVLTAGIILVLGAASVDLSAQDKIELPKILLPSPDAASLGKFGDIPVSYQTGIPSISIPLYEIQTSRLSVPIGLNYHSGGFRVDEIASSTGLGWSLNAGGSVNRLVRSFPDESNGGILNNGFTTYAEAPNQTYDWFISTEFCEQGHDTESDEYNFSTPQGSGKFVYDPDLDPLLIPQKPYKINYFPSASGQPDGYKIIDLTGTVFVYNVPEKTAFSPDGSISSCTKTYNSSWYLSMIVSADRSDTIRIEYEEKTSYTILSVMMLEEFGEPGCEAGHHGHVKTSSFSHSTYYPKVVKRITYRNGKVEFFFSNGRSDIGPTQGPRLDRIEVFNRTSGGDYVKLKTLALGMSYFHSGEAGQQGPEHYRLRLDAVEELDSLGQRVKIYQFDYEQSVLLPKRNSYARDLWGFYNGHNENTTLVPENYVLDHNGQSVKIGGANRQPSPIHMKAGLLKKMTYPTGGQTEFDYETHKFTISSSPGSMEAGGLRIKTTKHFDPISGQAHSEEYRYGEGENGIGELLIPENLLTAYYSIINYRHFVTTGGAPGCVSCDYSMKSFPAGPIFDISNFGGSSVLYSSVSRYAGSVITNSGKSVYQYDVYRDEIHFINPSYNVTASKTVSNQWKNGNLKKEVHYANRAGLYQKARQIDYLYSNTFDSEGFGLIIGRKLNESGTDCGLFNPDLKKLDLFFYGSYPVNTGRVLLDNVSTIEYDVNEQPTVSTTTKYFYDNLYHLQPTKTQVVGSRGDTISTQRKHALDLILSGDQETARLELVSRHMHSSVLHEAKLVNGQTTEKVINNYRKQNGTPLISDVQLQIGSAPAVTKLQFHKYDNSSNILEQSLANNVRMSYVWGYRNRYPIAEVSNASIGLETSRTASVKIIAVQNFHAYDVAKSTALQAVGSVTLGPYETSVETDYGITYNPMNDPSVPPNLRIVELIFRNSVTGADVIASLTAPGSGFPTTALTASTTYNVFYRTQHVEPVDIHINSISRIRTVKGANRQVFHTSFEDDVLEIAADARTGTVSHSGPFYTFYPSTPGDYVLSYWQKTGSSPWQYQEQILSVTGTSSTVLSMGLEGALIDEVRIYPKDAMMTTYTYYPGIGVTSSTDQNNNTTYYEYDTAGRLWRIKNDKGGIIQQYTYNYKQ